MKRHTTFINSSFGLLIILFSAFTLHGATNSAVKGWVFDAQTGESLPGANISILNTSLGAATDLEGKYIISQIPPGLYTLRVTYIGYESFEDTVLVKENEIIKKHFQLRPAMLEGETIVVTAQAAGQMKAINQQLSSSSIVDIVSEDRIRELPDATAAESVGRLPGVSISRQGGEGTTVTIRGMSSKYNKINIEGIEMAATGSENRSVDISMISPYLLAGIEVKKTVTADHDADAMGGTVNFKVREASKGLTVDLLTQVMNNGLRDSYNDYKLVGSVDQRFFNDKLGVLFLVDVESRTRDSETLSADYTRVLEGDVENIYVEKTHLQDVYRDKNRLGGALVVDYKFDQTKFKLVNFFSKSKTDIENYSETADAILSKGQRSSVSDGELSLITNSLGIEQDIFNTKLTAKVSHSQSKNNSKGGSWTFEDGSGLKVGANIQTSPQDMLSFAQDDTSRQFLTSINRSTDRNKETIWAYQADLEYDYALSTQITGKLKIGGKYKIRTREFEHDEFSIAASLESTSDVRNTIINTFGIAAPLDTRDLPLTFFIDPNYDNDKYLNGDFDLGPFPDINMLREIIRIFEQGGFPENQVNTQEVSSLARNYDGDERLSSAYLMTELSIGPMIEFSPGVRYERNVTKYKGIRGDTTTDPIPSRIWTAHHDTTLQRTNDFFLPMINLIIKPKDWFDIRLAYTESISWPDYRAIIPSFLISSWGITYGNTNLKPERASNYDLRFSFHNNTLGLLTVSGFYKKIEDQIFSTGRRVIIDSSDAFAFEGLDEFQFDRDVIGNGIFTTVNNENTGTIWGFELSWQTHFWYLPGFLNGLVFNANYTYIFSETKYPQTFIEGFFDLETYEYTQTNNDTTFEARLIGQPKNIVNLALGYDYKGFSSRISMLYQSDVFSGNDFHPNLRANTADLLRWDISIKQQLPIRNLDFTLNFVNITSTIDKKINRGTQSPTSTENFGRNIIAGLRYNF